MLKINHLTKKYPNGHEALRDISLSVNPGEFVAIIGASGSGKSTLLRTINQLIPLTSGEIFFEKKSITNLHTNDLRHHRSQIGMIFQHFNLISKLTVFQNVLHGSLSRVSMLKSLLGFYPIAEKQLALNYIELMGLLDFTHSRIDHLSGGQQQRVAIARSLMQKPKLILADEPVSSLDPHSAHKIMEYLEKINRDMNVTVICNLHDVNLVTKFSQRVIALKEGRILFDGPTISLNENIIKSIYNHD